MHVNQNTLRESIKAQLNDIKSDNNEYQTIARFLRTKQIVYKYFGTNNEYYKTISALDISDLSKFYSNNISSSYALFVTNFTLSLIDAIDNDLLSFRADTEIRALEVAGEFIDYATRILDEINNEGGHPAAVFALAGIGLESFLRQLALDKGLINVISEFNFDRIIDLLRQHSIIDKSDLKNLRVWADYRNDAAHGNFDKVKSPELAENVLQSIRLFLQKIEFSLLATDK